MLQVHIVMEKIIFDLPRRCMAAKTTVMQSSTNSCVHHVTNGQKRLKVRTGLMMCSMTVYVVSPMWAKVQMDKPETLTSTRIFALLPLHLLLCVCVHLYRVIVYSLR